MLTDKYPYNINNKRVLTNEMNNSVLKILIVIKNNS